MTAHSTAIALSLLVVGAVACGGPPGEDVGTTSAAASANNVFERYTISYAPNSYVIGNVYPGWTDELHGAPVFSKGPGNPDGADYQCGHLVGERFDHCGWIDRTVVHGSADSISCADSCPDTDEDGTIFKSTYTNGTVTPGGKGVGKPTHFRDVWPGCSDTNGYGNVEPWRVPATPHNSMGEVKDGKFLLWRYITKDGKWAMVFDPDQSSSLPNWYFVSRSCISLDDAAPPASPTPTPTPPPTPPPTPTCGELTPGQSLAQGAYASSCNGEYMLLMQGDGNVVLYEGSTVLWATGTNGAGGTHLDMQTDGNLVLYTASQAPVWATNTSGHPGAYLAVQEDGNIVVYDGTTAIWARFGL
jgi:hypothetical protein